jgi:hypothetical protein
LLVAASERVRTGERDYLTVAEALPCKPSDTALHGIPCRTGYHVTWDTMSHGIQCRDTVSHRVLCRMRYRVARDSVYHPVEDIAQVLCTLRRIGEPPVS